MRLRGARSISGQWRRHVSIGEVLTAAQREAGLSIADVSQRTRIRETIVREIERDDFSSCGGDFYARGHIRAIGRVLGIDPEPLVREYDARQGAADAGSAAPAAAREAPGDLRRGSGDGPGTPGTAHRAPGGGHAVPGNSQQAQPGAGSGTPGAGSGTPGTDSGAPGTGSGTPGDDSGTPGAGSGTPGTGWNTPGPSQGMLGARWSKPGRDHEPAPDTAAGIGGSAPPALFRYREPRRPNWSAALLVLVAVLAGVIIYHVVTANPGGRGPAAAGKSVAHKAARGHPAKRALARPASPGPASLVISLTAVSEPCWVNLTTPSGATIFQGVVQPGTSDTWSERKTVTLQLGNPGAITLTVDGKSRTGLGSDPVTLSLGPQPASG